MTDAANTAPDHPQIYLISPSVVALDAFPDQLARCLDTVPVACVRLALATTDESDVARAADAAREVCHARDVAIVMAEHRMMVERLGLDGVHLSDAGRSVRAVRKELGEDAVVGAFCGTSSHDGMTAGELSADYVSFGPAGTSSLGGGEVAELSLFEWWSQMIEVPVVAEGALDAALIRQLAPHCDFFGIGDEIWREDDPQAVLKTFAQAMM